LSLNSIIEEVLKAIPKVDKILEEALKELGLEKASSEEIFRRFDFYVSQLEATAFKIYSKYEDEAFNKLKNLWVETNSGRLKQIIREKEIDSLSQLLTDLIQVARHMEFRLGNVRKARGGATFQKIVKVLLNMAGVPCEEPHKETKAVLKRIDLVSPDAQTAKDTPDKAIFLAIKRTLRERWKQVVPEHMKGARLYLITLNHKCSAKKANEIKETGMVAYVKDELKDKPHLKDKTWIRKLSKLPKDIRNTVPAKKL